MDQGSKIHILSSESSGNGYILETSTSALLIEAGVHFKHVNRVVDYDKISGLLVSHSHGDHAGFLHTYSQQFIEIFGNESTVKEHGLSVEHGKVHKLDEWKYVAFNLEHDVPNFGYFIKNDDIGNIVFATDTSFIKNRFKDVNIWMIEANYSDEIIKERVADGSLDILQAKRVMYSHMSIETAIKTIKANGTGSLDMVVLIHLSSGNSDAKLFKNMVESETGVPCYVADKNMEIQI